MFVLGAERKAGSHCARDSRDGIGLVRGRNHEGFFSLYVSYCAVVFGWKQGAVIEDVMEES